MLKNFIIRKGVVNGQTIVLEEGTGLPEGQKVLVGIGLTEAECENSEKAKEELAQELEAEEALQTIYRMRHSGRSICEL